MSAMEDYMESQEYQRELGVGNDCPECECRWIQVPEESCENQDADGNRGIKVYTVTCPDCGEEVSWTGGFC